MSDTAIPVLTAELSGQNEQTGSLTSSTSVTEMPQGITCEIVAVLGAAATAFLGKKVHLLSIKILEGEDVDSSAWASQGRDMIQSSHNLIQRGH